MIMRMEYLVVGKTCPTTIMTIRIYREFRSVVGEHKRTLGDVSEIVVDLLPVFRFDGEAIEANMRVIIM